ncbi:MAG: cobyrinate a,c-diamide synthase [Pseudobutyrivibrio sp.]|uniref:cobyrinate a,c-diamide synthase n=1 Tax=Pseudobutyrivibrio sp. TaxID=2014367 RepID=UPI0025D42B60|nr:cobyrinate a,c-diamide synthase [Pseudobutyrivibrio sp.]MBE5903355.1 cobyrinate a,c-diamide synthase [Pseudobutyrivibrio sp.]
MNCYRIMLAANKSGSGKTTITCGLLGALKERGLNPCSFKCGPDYIDPMFHRNVLGIPSGNLDTFFTEDDVTRELFENEFSGDIAVIEGVMGLFDGIGGVELTGSSYDLARVLKTPIILVIDAKGAGRSVLAEIRGFLDYDSEHLIKGVILNKTSKAFGAKLADLIEEELHIKCFGTVAEEKNVELSSRHLGLYLPQEIDDINKKLEKQKNLVLDGVDIDGIIELSKTVPEIKAASKIFVQPSKASDNKLRLGVARDEAFCFYYRENLAMLQARGVELVEFSPLRDHHLPENISGILLGGGYPENYLSALQGNTQIKAEIKKAMDRGIPMLAECGGFMYLLDNIKNEQDKTYNMIGAINGSAYWTGKLVRFGYVTIEAEGFEIKGHEFHYYDTDNNGSSFTAKKPTGNRSWQCIHKVGPSYIGFPHLYYPSAPVFVDKFVEAMKNYGGN